MNMGEECPTPEDTSHATLYMQLELHSIPVNTAWNMFLIWVLLLHTSNHQFFENMTLLLYNLCNIPNLYA